MTVSLSCGTPEIFQVPANPLEDLSGIMRESLLSNPVGIVAAVITFISSALTQKTSKSKFGILENSQKLINWKVPREREVMIIGMQPIIQYRRKSYHAIPH